jgi:hypothetical protein
MAGPHRSGLEFWGHNVMDGKFTFSNGYVSVSELVGLFFHAERKILDPLIYKYIFLTRSLQQLTKRFLFIK